MCVWMGGSSQAPVYDATPVRRCTAAVSLRRLDLAHPAPTCASTHHRLAAATGVWCGVLRADGLLFMRPGNRLIIICCYAWPNLSSTPRYDDYNNEQFTKALSPTSNQDLVHGHTAWNQGRGNATGLQPPPFPGTHERRAGTQKKVGAAAVHFDLNCTRTRTRARTPPIVGVPLSAT